MHPLCVLGLFYVGQLFAAWYTSNYLSPTIYVFSENGATSMIDAYQFILLNFFHASLLGCLNIFFPFKPIWNAVIKMVS